MKPTDTHDPSTTRSALPTTPESRVNRSAETMRPDQTRPSADTDPPASPPNGPRATLRHFARNAFDDFLGVRGATPEERELIRRPAVAALRRTRSWVLPVAATMVASVFLCWFWVATEDPWHIVSVLYWRIVVVESLVGVTVLLTAAAAAKRRHVDAAFLQDLSLTTLDPGTLALSAVSAIVATWILSLLALIPLEIGLVFQSLVRRTVQGSTVAATPWLLIRSAACAVAAGALFGWFHLETVRLAAWSATLQILPRVKKPTSAMRQDVSHEGSVAVAYGVFLALLSIPLVLLFIALIFGMARLFGVEILLSDLHRLPEAQLIAWLGTVGFFLMFKRRFAEASLDQFALRWLPMTWRGVAEPDAAPPPQLRLAMVAWSTYRRARTAIRSCRGGGRFAAWRARLVCGRYRWLVDNRVHLDPKRHRVVGWGPFRRAAVEPGDNLALEVPDVPLPYDPNPDRVLGTPIGGPTRLESPGGSVVEPIECEKGGLTRRIFTVLPAIAMGLRQIFQLLSAFLGFVCLPIFLGIEVYLALSPMSGKDLRITEATLGAAALSVLLALASGAIRVLLRRWAKRRVGRREGRLFTPAPTDILLAVEDARTFHLPKPGPEDIVFLRITPGWLEIEGMAFRARLRAGEFQMQIHETPIGRGLLLTSRLNGALWGVTLQPGSDVVSLIPMLRDRRIRAFRARIAQAVADTPASSVDAALPAAGTD